MYTMVMNGVTDDREYGKLISWEENTDACVWACTMKQFLPGMGLMVMEVQQRLLHFLLLCCQQIMHEISPDDLPTTGEYSPSPPAPVAVENNGDSSIVSVATLTAEAPYQLPAKLDLARVEALLDAKASDIEDHLWALREDPGYFSSVLAEMKEHRQELISDIEGRTHPTLWPNRQSILWSRIIGNLLSENIELEIFSELYRQAQNLKILQKRYSSIISPQRDLPEDFLDALITFRYFVEQAAKGVKIQLKDNFAASPEWRKFFVRLPPESAHSTKITTVTKPGVAKNNLQYELLWLLSVIWEDDYQLFFLGQSTALDEVERLVQTDPKAQDIFSGRVSRIINSLSILCQCLSQLDLYQPLHQDLEAQ